MGIRIVANIDAQEKLLGRVAGVINLVPIPSFPELVTGDSEVVDLSLTSQGGQINLQDYPLVRLGIGTINGRPTGGSYTLEGETLAFDHTAAQLQTVISAEVAAATVTQVSPFVFVAQFTANGAQTLPTVNATALTPASTVNVARLVAGNGSTPERWIIRLYRDPIALVSTFTALGSNDLRGVLNTGTQGIYALFSEGQEVVSSTIELEVTDATGAIQTLFQLPVAIRGEVLGEGVPAVVSFDSLVTQSQLGSAFEIGNTVFVDQENGNNSTGTRGRADLPFLTMVAAETAASEGDLILARQGDFSAETLNGKNNCFYWFLPNVIGPIFIIDVARTVRGKGLCKALSVNNPSAVIDMPEMDAVSEIFCSSGTLTARNSGPLEFTGTANCTILGNILETRSNANAVSIGNDYSGTLRIKGNIKAVAGTSKGINYGTGVTGTVILDNSTIETSGVSIDAPAAQSVIVQGTLNVTQDVDSDITIVGGSKSVNTNYRAF